MMILATPSQRPEIQIGGAWGHQGEEDGTEIANAKLEWFACQSAPDVCLESSLGRLHGSQLGTLASKPARDVCLEASSEHLLRSQLGTFAWKPARNVCLEASSGRLLASQLGMFAWKPARHVCFEASLGGLLASQLGMLAFSGRLLANQLETPLFAHSCFIKGPSGTAVWRNHITKGRFGTAACAQL